MSDEPITVFLADDHAMVREGLAALVSEDDRIQVVGQTGDGLRVTEEIRRLSPRVVLLDVTMPGLNGLDVCREISRKFKDTAVLILTMHDDEQFIATALENGASGYILKEGAADELCEAVRKVAQGELCLGTGVPKSAVLRAVRGNDDPYNRLTTRERQVLQLIAEGKTNRAIADELGLAVKTIDTHRSRLMRKLGIHDQTSLVKYALRRGIISLD
jgi:DNA-binding NarL/FixJ family response regulator